MKYYLQSTNGIYVYEPMLESEDHHPVKIALSSVDLDGTQYYGNQISLGKDVSRVAFNLFVFGFRPNSGFTSYYKLDGVDSDYTSYADENRSIYYTNLPGGSYDFHFYVVDEYGQESNRILIHLEKGKNFIEQWWFWAALFLVAGAVLFLVSFFIIRYKTRQSLKRQMEYKSITLESLQAIARTIDAKDSLRRKTWNLPRSAGLPCSLYSAETQIPEVNMVYSAGSSKVSIALIADWKEACFRVPVTE